jgi:hypothetical protein
MAGLQSLQDVAEKYYAGTGQTQETTDLLEFELSNAGVFLAMERAAALYLANATKR